MSRRTFLRNITSNWVMQFWGIGWGIVMVPVFLKFLGKTDYGIWILINSLVGYYGLMGLGIRPSIVRYVARYIGLEDKRSLNEVFNTAFVVQIGLGVVAVGVSVVLAVVLPGVEGFALSAYERAGQLLLIVGITAALSFVGGSFAAALGGAERFDVSNLLRIIFSLITNLGLIGVLAAGGGLIGMATVLLAVAT